MKNKLKILLSENIAKAIEELIEEINSESKHYNDLIIIKGKYSDLKRQQNVGLISNEDIKLAKNQIRNSLLSIIDDLNKSDFNKTNISKDKSKDKKGSFLANFDIRLGEKVLGCSVVLISFAFIVLAITIIRSTPKEEHFLSDNRIEKFNPYGHTNIIINKHTIVDKEEISKNEILYKVEGEAYFEIDKNNRFKKTIININTIQLVITGTSFNIRAYPDEPMIEISVFEGSINCQNQDDKFTISGNEQIRFDLVDEASSLVKSDNVYNSKSWFTNTFNFNDIELNEALEYIRRVYDVDFPQNTSDTDSIKISGEYNLADSLELLLQDIEVDNNFKFTQSSNEESTIDSNYSTRHEVKYEKSHLKKRYKEALKQMRATKYDKAIFMLESVELEINNTQSSLDLLNEIYSNLALCYSKISKTSKAIVFYDKAIEFSLQNGLRSRIPQLHVDKGDLLIQSNEYNEAILCYNNLIKFLKNTGSPDYLNISIAYFKIGNLHFNIDDLDSAINILEEGIAYLEPFNDSEECLNCALYLNLSNIYFLTKQYSKAKEIVHKTINLSKKYNNIEEKTILEEAKKLNKKIHKEM